MNAEGNVAANRRARDDLFEEAVQAYLEVKEAGSVSKDELLVRYAAVAAELADFFAAEELVGAVLVPPTTMRPEATRGGATSAAPPRKLEPFGHYIDLELLDDGGMGSVYRCRDTDLGRPLALKVMHAYLARIPDFVRDFREEAQVASQLTHPNIAPVHELGWLPDRRPYFTMKLVEGRTLAEVIREYHAAKTAERFDALLRHFVAVCNAVAYAHQRQVLHRDLKPANVMVGAFGEVQVMDWGLSKVVRPGETGRTAAIGPRPPEAVTTGGSELPTDPGLVRGTFAYMPPEQASATTSHVDVRSDVFALGAVLCEILTGAPPYTSNPSDPVLRRDELWNAARTWATNPAFSRLDASGAPAELVALAKHCLARMPEQRPETATAVAAGVTAYMAGVQEKLRAEEVRRARAEAKAAEERKKRRWQLGLAAATLLLLTSIVTAWMWYRYDRERQERQRVVQELLSDQRVAESLREADHYLDQSAPRKALEAARRALALSQDERISEEKRSLVKQRVSELERSIADDERDQQLQDRVMDLALPLESQGTFFGVQPPDLDAQIESAFRQFGLNFSVLSDAELLNHFERRPEAVRNGLVAAIDLWAIKSRQYPNKAALSIRLLKLARAIDPDPVRDELRRIMAELPVGAVSFQIWARMVAPLERILPDSKYERLLDIARSDPDRLPTLTVQLLADLLVSLNETDRALTLVRQALQTNPGSPGLHATAALILLLGKKPQKAEAIVHLEALRVLRPNVGSLLALLLAKEGREQEALTLCSELSRMQPDALMPWYGRSAALLSLKRYKEAEQVLRESIRQHPNSGLLLSVLAQALYEQKNWIEAERVGREAVRLEPDNPLALNNHGLTLFGLKAYPEAEAAFRKAIFQYGRLVPSDRQGPDAALFHSNLGLILAYRKKYDEASAECRLALHFNENLHFAHINLAVVFAAQEKWAEAEASLRKAIQLRDDEPVAYTNLGVALLKQNKVAEASLACQKALRLDESVAVTQTLRGMIAKKEKKFAEAAEAFRTAIRLDPSYADARSELGLLLLDLKQPDEAEASSREAVRLAPDNPDVRQGLGFVLMRRKKYTEAVEAYQKAIELAPKQADGYSGLAMVYTDWGKRNAAAEFERKAVNLAPQEVKYRRFLAEELLEQGKHDEAIAELQAALKINPDDSATGRDLGFQLLNAGRPLEAIEPLRHATKLKPDNVKARVNLGQALDATGKPDEAMTAYKAAANLNPSDIDGLYWRSQALQSLGRLREAEQVCLRIVRLKPDDAEFHFDLGMVRFERHRYRAAAEAYQDAIRLNPKNADAYDLLGDAEMPLRQFSEAIRAYQKAIEINPKDTDAHRGLAEVFRETGKFHEALAILEKLDSELPRPSPARVGLIEEIDRTRELQNLDAVLPDYVAERRHPADIHEWLLVAELCMIRGRSATAALCYAGALDADPKRSAALLRANLLRAVSCAVEAACGTEGTAEERAGFQRRARGWFKRVLSDFETQATAVGATDKEREAISDNLRSWQDTPLFESIRGPVDLAKLPEAERKEWQKFWSDVDVLLKKLELPVPEPAPKK